MSTTTTTTPHGVIVTETEDYISFRLPSWLTDDERARSRASSTVRRPSTVADRPVGGTNQLDCSRRSPLKMILSESYRLNTLPQAIRKQPASAARLRIPVSASPQG